MPALNEIKKGIDKKTFYLYRLLLFQQTFAQIADGIPHRKETYRNNSKENKNHIGSMNAHRISINYKTATRPT